MKANVTTIYLFILSPECTKRVQPAQHYRDSAALPKGNAKIYSRNCFTASEGVTITSSMANDVDDPKMTPRDFAEPLRRAIGERYLTYALSTIMHRALPDARDGLK